MTDILRSARTGHGTGSGSPAPVKRFPQAVTAGPAGMIGTSLDVALHMADVNDWNRKIIEEFRANGGKVGGQFEGAPMLVLHTKGAKSGEPRVNPMVYQDLGGSYAVFASYAGAPTNPAWYHNLVANPDVEIEVGTERKRVTARVLEGAERQPIWEKQKADMPGFAEYEAKTDRTIPVVVLEPAS